MAKYKEKQQARQLRREGVTIPKIAETVGAAKSTVSLWVRDIRLTQEQLDRIKSKGQQQAANKNKQERIERQKKLQQEGRGRIGNIKSDRELLLVGTALYWGEGHKAVKGTVGMANSDPAVIKLFIRWLNKCFGVPISKMRIGLNIHEDMDQQEIEEYWRQATKFCNEQFQKTQVARNTVAGLKKKQAYRGTATILVHNANLQYKIQGMLEQLRLW